MAGRLLCIAVVAALAFPAAASASVAYVGDSLGVGTVPYLRGELDGVAISDDSEIGRPSAAALPVLESLISPDADVVVFDLGTNDDPANPDALASNLLAARQIAGSRCMVTATLNRPPVNGVAVDGLNRAVTAFAAADGNVALVDWHGRAAANPSLLLDDGVHPSPDGYALRARLFAAAINACGSGDAPPRQNPDRPHRDADRADLIEVPEPQRDKPTGAVRAVAGEVAKSVAVGAEFG